MKEVTLSTGQAATIRSKDELTEGQSRKIEIARSRGAAVFAKYGVTTDGSTSIPPSDMSKLTDEDWLNINGFTDTLIDVMTVSLNGETVMNPTELPKPVYDALNEAVSAEYGGLEQTTESVDDKIDPLAAAAESTPSSTEAAT